MASTKTGKRARRSPAGSRRPSSKGFPTWALVAFVVAVVVALILLTRPDSGTDTATSAGQRVAHVHGLGINPADGDLYAATHFGLFRIAANGNSERVGDAVQDTMGFTVVGPNHFLGSGHPDPKDTRLRKPDRPPLLGLIESTDGGRSWDPVSLLGEADFHSLVAAHGNVYGYDSTGGRFMVSADGRQWETRSQARIGDFAVDPGDAEHLVATTQRGVAESRDGGRSWEPTDGPQQLAFLSWGSEQGLWAVAATGETYRRVEGRWEPREALAGRPQALLVTSDELYAAVSSGNRTAIYASSDEGRSWRLRYSEDA